MATFPKEFSHFLKPKVAIAEFFWKTWYSILDLDAMPLSLKNLLLSEVVYKTDLNSSRIQN